jgi:hypothetical protein
VNGVVDSKAILMRIFGQRTHEEKMEQIENYIIKNLIICILYLILRSRLNQKRIRQSI